MYLLDIGALVTKRCPNHKPDVSYNIVLLCIAEMIKCGLQRSPLLVAAKHGHERVVQILLQQGNVDVNISSTTTGYNCLCEAVVRGHR